MKRVHYLIGLNQYSIKVIIKHLPSHRFWPVDTLNDVRHIFGNKLHLGTCAHHCNNAEYLRNCEPTIYWMNIIDDLYLDRLISDLFFSKYLRVGLTLHFALSRDIASIDHRRIMNAIIRIFNYELQ